MKKEEALKAAKVLGLLALLGGASMAWLLIARRIRSEVMEEVKT